MATPLVAHAVGDRLSPFRPDADIAAFQGIDTLIVLGGDNVVGRVRESVLAYKRATPDLVFVSGDAWLVDRLLEAGIPPISIVRDPISRNTRQQMDAVQRLLIERPGKKAAVVASRLQMPRVAALAAARKLPLQLVTSPIDDEPPRTGARRLIPSYIALRVTRDALYEYAALAYYHWRGWL